VGRAKIFLANVTSVAAGMVMRSMSRPPGCQGLSGTSGSVTGGTASRHASFADPRVTWSRRWYAMSGSVLASCAAVSSPPAFDTAW